MHRLKFYLSSVWEMKIQYKVLGASAKAIWILVLFGDMRMTLGAIIPVEKVS